MTHQLQKRLNLFFRLQKYNFGTHCVIYHIVLELKQICDKMSHLRKISGQNVGI